jgi:hypothetical protein
VWNGQTIRLWMLLSICLLSVTPTIALAQTPATTWQGFMLLAEAGQSVKVIDRHGQTVNGRVEHVTVSGLDLLLPRNQRRTVSAAEVVRVVRVDSNANGMLLGLLGGLGVGALAGRSGCGGDPSCSAAQLEVGLPVGAGVGLLVGYLFDATRTRTLFLSDNTPTVAVVFALGRGKVGARITVGWH